MDLQIILLLVLLGVLVLDYVINARKKSNENTSDNRIESSDNLNRKFKLKFSFSLDYFIKRKRNALTFILLAVLFKPVLHNFFSPEFVETISNDKTYIGVNEPTLRLLDGMKVSDTIYFYDYQNQKSYFTMNKYHFTYIHDKVFVKNDEKLSSIFYQNKWEPRFGDVVSPIVEALKFYNNLVDFLKANSYDGFNKDYFKKIENEDYSNGYTLINKSIIENWIAEGKIKEPKSSLNHLTLIFEVLAEANLLNIGFGFKGDKKISLAYVTVLNYKYYYELVNKVKSTDNVYTVNGEKIYLEDSFQRTGRWDKEFYYYEIIKEDASLQFHYQNIFKRKVWLFIISFSILGLIVFLLNDKIKAR